MTFGINIIVGEQLSSLNFVMDYLEFHFEDLVLTVNTNPSVILNGKKFTMGDDGWRDAFCSFIARIVSDTRINDEVTEMVVTFEGIDQLVVPLWMNKHIPEAATLRGPNHQFNCW